MKELVLLLALTLVLATSGLGSAVQKPMLLATTNQASSLQTINTSNYINITASTLNMHMQDMVYSSIIRREFFNRNISSIDALAATISLYTLDSEIQKEIQSISPPRGSEYQEYHRRILGSMASFKRHLLFMAKFFETGDQNYLNSSREQLNISSQEFSKAVNLGRNLSQSSNLLQELRRNGTPVDVSKLGFPA
jgi:hypothetical protein